METADKIRKLTEEQEKSASEGEDLKKKIEEKRRKEIEAALERKRAVQKRRAEEEAYFNANRQEFINKEKKFEDQEKMVKPIPTEISKPLTPPIPNDKESQQPPAPEFLIYDNDDSADTLFRPELFLIMRTLMGTLQATRMDLSVHRVMQASLMLLNKDEGLTKEWMDDFKLARRIGRETLAKHLISVTADSKHPEILARIREILNSIDRKEFNTNEDLRILHGWVSSLIENEVIEDVVFPADIDRQKEIFRGGKKMKK